MGSITIRIPKGIGGAVRERDAEFTEFFRAEYPGLVRMLYLVTRDQEQARDIAQEAFIKLFARGGNTDIYGVAIADPTP